MRVSLERGDRAYHPMCSRAVVQLDGMPVRRCLTADDEEGIVRCMVLDSYGLPLLEPDSGEQLIQTLHGHVTITVPYEVAVEITP